MLDSTGLDLIFRKARTRNGWQAGVISETQLREIYDLARLAPTSANTNPGRFVFVRKDDEKARLAVHLSPGNRSKTLAAPCCVIVAQDTQFFELMPKLFPGRDARSPFVANPALANETATRNTTLQGAYLMIAARALGYDVGAMSGFDRKSLDADFFPDGRWRSEFLVNIGHGTDENLFPRNPRLEFEEACRLL